MELRGPQFGPGISDQDAGRLLNQVLDAGINLIDTSIDYGSSEELIGRHVGHRRDEFFLASKCGCLLGPPPPGARPPFPHDWSAAWAASGVDELLDGMSRLEFVLRFTISHPALSSTIVGTSNPGHLWANLAIAEMGPLPADLYQRAKVALQPAAA